MGIRKMNWHIYSYRYTGDDMVIFTDGYRWVSYDSVAYTAVNDASDADLRLLFHKFKSDLDSFDSYYQNALASSSIPCGVDFADEFWSDRLSYIALVCDKGEN